MSEGNSQGDNTQSPDNANGGGQQPEPGTGVLFSQDQVNTFNKRSNEKAAKQAVSSLLEGLGLQSADELTALVNAQKEAQEAAKSELDKAKEAQAKAEQKAAATLKVANDKLIRAAFMAEAGKLLAAHPQDAYLLADLSTITLTDEGEVTGVEDAVKALVDSGRLTIAGKPAPPNLDNGAGSGKRPGDKSEVDKLTPAEVAMAQRLGVSLEDYAKNKKK